LTRASSRHRREPPKATLTRLGIWQLRVAERASMVSETPRASGRQSKGSSRETPASSEHMTLRMVWPQAERLVNPSWLTFSSTSATLRSATQWNSTF
jgi:hypothetical protein